jgi:hypothetical protein
VAYANGPARLFTLVQFAFWRLDLGYFGRGLLGSWPQADAGGRALVAVGLRQ